MPETTLRPVFAESVENLADSSDDYFSHRGHLDLALSLLRASLYALEKDPYMDGEEARFEIAWLKGQVKDSLLPVETVLATLKLENWAASFAQMAASDPKGLLARLGGLSKILAEMAGASAQMRESPEQADLDQAHMDATIDSYRERARAC